MVLTLPESRVTSPEFASYSDEDGGTIIIILYAFCPTRIFSVDSGVTAKETSTMHPTAYSERWDSPV